jgi:hypothetical protein
LKKEIEVTLPSGHTIQLFEHEGKMVLGLVNSSGYYVSDTKLTETEVNTLTKIMNDYQAEKWLLEETN